MTVRIKLTSEEIVYLMGTGFVHPGLSEQLKSVSASQDSFLAVEISEEEADALRDRLGEELQRDGFDEAYNPTPKGRILEGLIDKLFVG